MRSMDEDIKFWLTQQGWYLGETQIREIDEIEGIRVCVDSLDSRCLAYYERGKIYASRALVTFASLPQRRLAMLHELAHPRLNIKHLSLHDQEYACDRWALQRMINSGDYTFRELLNAIGLFTASWFVEGDTKTHPASKKRYKRLYNQLMESVS